MGEIFTDILQICQQITYRFSIDFLVGMYLPGSHINRYFLNTLTGGVTDTEFPFRLSQTTAIESAKYDKKIKKYILF